MSPSVVAQQAVQVRDSQKGDGKIYGLLVPYILHRAARDHAAGHEVESPEVIAALRDGEIGALRGDQIGSQLIVWFVPIVWSYFIHVQFLFVYWTYCKYMSNFDTDNIYASILC